MDLGGASTQITFEMASPVEDPTNEVQLRLYGQHYRVYTHSFLCYGRDQVLRRLLASALQVPPWTGGARRDGAEGAEQSLDGSRAERASPRQQAGQVGEGPGVAGGPGDCQAGEKVEVREPGVPGPAGTGEP